MALALASKTILALVSDRIPLAGTALVKGSDRSLAEVSGKILAKVWDGNHMPGRTLASM